MNRVELLSPAGTMDCLIAAVNAGADAVYISGKLFGARAFAGNFSKDELIEAINYAHLRNVKIYVTVNTMIYESEISQVYDYLVFLYENNVDAVIVQDLGIIKLIHDKIPNLEIHASTQCHNHNLEGINLLKKYNVKRVVLDREMTIEQVKKLTNQIDIEVFIHGALCVSYSGCCLFSALETGRSGNRGACVQSCRHAYSLYENSKNIINSKYLLSTKELCTLEIIPNLIASGIKSFKIEGRMKSPAYVGIVTSIYRKYIDAYYNNVPLANIQKDIDKLLRLFNRQFTKGFIGNEKNIINSESSNHQGVEIGKVVNVTAKKITISLTETLNQNDGIRFKNAGKGMIVNMLYDQKGLLKNSVNKTAIIDNKVELKKNDIVLKTIDYRLEKDTIFPDKKIPIDIVINAFNGQKINAWVSDGTVEICKEGTVVSKALKLPITKDNIINQFSKTGETVYKVNSIKVNMDDNIFINLKDLNTLRRELLEDLNAIKIGNKQQLISKTNEKIIDIKKDTTKRINILVRNEKQLETVLNLKCGDIYVTDYDLYQKYYKNHNNLYYRLSRVNNTYKDIDCDKLLISEIGSMEKYAGKDMISDYTLNILNNESIAFLEENNIKRVTLSVENTMELLKKININKHNLEIIVYGRVELMIIKSPIINSQGYLENNFKEHYPIYNDNNHVIILSKNNLDNINNISEYLQLGINNFRIDLYDEDTNQILKIVKKVNEYMK